jgi:hypothetical protein
VKAIVFEWLKLHVDRRRVARMCFTKLLFKLLLSLSCHWLFHSYSGTNVVNLWNMFFVALVCVCRRSHNYDNYTYQAYFSESLNKISAIGM